MPKPKDAEGFDVAGTRYRQHEVPRDLLGQAVADYKTSVPHRNFTCRVNGNSVTVYCHVHEQCLGDPGKRAACVDAASKAMDKYVKGLKKRFREMGGGTLDIAEVKDRRGYDLQKTSLNDRWELVYRRVYEVADLVEVPKD